jgi:hypothetical protein
MALFFFFFFSLFVGPQMKKFIAKKMKQQHPSSHLLFSLQVPGMCSSYANVLSLERRKGCQHGFKWV